MLVTFCFQSKKINMYNNIMKYFAHAYIHIAYNICVYCAYYVIKIWHSVRGVLLFMIVLSY